jgi:SOS-response transcriptional repressor LexA
MSPIFTNKDILIFKTNCDYENRDFVLIDISKQKNLIFRQLLIDGANMLLKPINKDFPIINMNENDNIIAKLVKSVKDF